MKYAPDFLKPEQERLMGKQAIQCQGVKPDRVVH